MTLPSAAQCQRVVAQTWPAAAQDRHGPWMIRRDPSNSSRTCAATAEAAWAAPDIDTAAAAMRSAGQVPLFMIRGGDDALDAALAARGYTVKDPVNIYAAPITRIARQRPPPVTAFTVWPPLAVQTDIWNAGGIGPGRLAIMNRAPHPKTTILGRVHDRPAGTLFVAIAENCAMIHALSVADRNRRQGLARFMSVAAAFWAAQTGAQWLTLVTTGDNGAANALYASIGMVCVGQYHYRIAGGHGA